MYIWLTKNQELQWRLLADPEFKPNAIVRRRIIINEPQIVGPWFCRKLGIRKLGALKPEPENL